MFFLKAEHKLFIKICCHSKETLVFDTKNHRFYFNTNINPNLLRNKYSTNGSTVYEVSVDSHIKYKKVSNSEIKSYQYENGRLVADKLKVKGAEKRNTFFQHSVLHVQYV